MTDENKICYNCFKQLKENEEICPVCGFCNDKEKDNYMLALPYGTVLAGRYITGRVLGKGGFGITYAAKDNKTGKKIALKEFFPETIANRKLGSYTVSTYSADKQESFAYGLESFINEAKVLAKFSRNPNIVNIYNCFKENGTAYFTMEYIEGINFKQYLKNKGGKVSWQEAVMTLTPVMEALTAVHKDGIIHRDVTPDNIYITKDGRVKLLDFGSARFVTGDKTRTLDVVLKPGYAPKEQYLRRGKQGPYTDVYSVAACFYSAITGYIPPEATERWDNDTIIPLYLRAKLPERLENAILKGLEVDAEDRFQNMDDFLAEINAVKRAANFEEEERRRKVEEEQKRLAEEKRRAEEESKRKAAEEEQKRKAEEEQRRKAEEESKRKAAEEERKRKAEEEQRRKAEEESKRKAAEEERKRKAEEEQRRKAEEESKRKAAEEKRKRRAEAERRKKEAERKKKEKENDTDSTPAKKKTAAVAAAAAAAVVVIAAGATVFSRSGDADTKTVTMEIEEDKTTVDEAAVQAKFDSVLEENSSSAYTKFDADGDGIDDLILGKGDEIEIFLSGSDANASVTLGYSFDDEYLFDYNGSLGYYDKENNTYCVYDLSTGETSVIAQWESNGEVGASEASSLYILTDDGLSELSEEEIEEFLDFIRNNKLILVIPFDYTTTTEMPAEISTEAVTEAATAAETEQPTEAAAQYTEPKTQAATQYTEPRTQATTQYTEPKPQATTQYVEPYVEPTTKYIEAATEEYTLPDPNSFEFSKGRT